MMTPWPSYTGDTSNKQTTPNKHLSIMTMMKSSIATSILLIACYGILRTSGLAVNRKEFLNNFAKTAGATAAVSFPHPLPSNAFDPQTFNHQYSDPKHPNCKRIVVVTKEGEAKISGTDGTPGCDEDGSGNVWRLVGEVEGKNILVDFSPKGGPANLKGVWDGDGIKWPDGNKWSVKN